MSQNCSRLAEHPELRRFVLGQRWCVGDACQGNFGSVPPKDAKKVACQVRQRLLCENRVMPEAPSQRRFLIAMMLFVIVVINYLDRSNISIVGPQLSRTLNLTPVKLGIVLSGFGWTYVALQIPCGWLVDRVHPRYLFAFILALWSLATFSLGLATGFVGLLLLRMAVGAF